MKQPIDFPVVDHCEGVCKNNSKCKKYFIDNDSSLGYKYTCSANKEKGVESFKEMWDSVYKSKEEEKNDE